MFDIEEFAQKFFKLLPPPLIERWEEEWENITLHTQGRDPKRLIGTRRPYEDATIKEYREKNWEPITKDPFIRAITNLQRIFTKASVDVSAPEGITEYTDLPVFRGVDLETFFNRHVLRRMIDDPNGVLVWWVEEVPKINEPVGPQPYLVLSKNVHYMSKDAFAWLSPEKSMVLVKEDGKEVEREVGNVYYICTKEGYYKMVQVGRQKDNEFEFRTHYLHKLNRLPIMVLGGEEVSETNTKTNEEEFWYTTFFAPAVPYANECMRQFSDHQGIMVTSAFPIREMDAIKCTYKGCKNGYIEVVKQSTNEGDIRQQVETQECPNCHGRGKLIPAGPFGVFFRQEANLMNEGAGRDVPAVRYITPDVAIIEYSGNYWQKLLERLEKALHLLFIEQSQSGVAKEIDREDKTATLDRIGAHIFHDLFLNSLIIIGRLRKVAFEETDIVISLPPTFVAKTEDDLLKEVKTLRDGGVGPLFLNEAQQELIRKRFPGNWVIERKSEILSSYDLLNGYTNEEKVTMRASGSVDEMTFRRSLFAPAMLNVLVEREGAEVLDMEFDAISAKLDDLINQLPVEEPEEEVDPQLEQEEEEDMGAGQ